MPFHEPSDVAQIAAIILHTLRLPAPPRSRMRQYKLKLLTCMCRELEKLIQLDKSEAAQKNADQLGLGDLRQYAWIHRSKLPGSIDEGFHFEHTVPVKMLVMSLLNLSAPTIKDVEDIIATAQVSWVTRRENKELDKRGYHHNRPDPVKAYAEAGIVLCRNG
jgi:hypothetical protein